MTNLACSGAKLTNGILQSQEINKLSLTPQLDKMFEKVKPDIITITIGANDARWTEIITKCYLSTCGDTQDLVSIKQSLATISDNLHSTLQKIEQQYPKNPPKVFVTGYYQVFPETVPAKCSDLQNISENEIKQGRTLLASLSQTIQATTNNFDNVEFIAIDFSGHELCSQDPWVQGLNAKAPYHPNAMGQKAIAEQISSAIENDNNR
jgi:lysophospholipase L1-like esterase